VKCAHKSKKLKQSLKYTTFRWYKTLLMGVPQWKLNPQI